MYKKLFISALCAVSAVQLSSCKTNYNCFDQFNQDAHLSNIVYYEKYFNTQINIKVCYKEDVSKDEKIETNNSIENMFSKYDDLFSSRNEVEGVNNIYYINNNPETEISIDEDLNELLSLAIDYHSNDDGLFNIAYNPVISIYEELIDKYQKGEDITFPLDSELDDASSNTNISDITLEDSKINIKNGMSLNVSGAAKGYATYKLTEFLDNNTYVDGYIINTGNSSISVGGDNPHKDRNHYDIGILKPSYNNLSEIFEVTSLNGGYSISTSGDYQNFFKIDNDYYHHLIDTNTNKPKLTNIKSVSVISKHRKDLDIISTIAFLYDIENSREFIESLNGVEAIWYLEDDTIIKSSSY